MLSKVQISYSKDTAKALVMAIVAGLLGTGVAVIGSVAPASAAACGSGSSSATYSGGDGTTSSTAFRISTSADLIRLSATSSDWTGKFFIQTADIDLGGCEWTPIGSSGTPFTGTYDGGGFAIDGLSINQTSGSSNPVGLFGAGNGNIKNFVLRGQITSDNAYVGGVLGTTTGNLTRISNVRSEVNITFSGGNYAGGIVGQLSSTNRVDYSSYEGTMSGSSSSGSLGGIAGFGSGVINGSYSIASMSGASRFRAGFSGWATPSVLSSYAATTGGSYGVATGGITSSSAVFWDTTTMATTTANRDGSVTGSTGKTTTEMKDIATYQAASWAIVDGWDTFTTVSPAKIWGICSRVNDGYPFLLWEYTSDPCTVTPPPSSGGGSSGSFVAPVVVPEAVVIPDTVAQRKIRTNPVTGAKRLAGSSLKRDVVFAADSTVLTAAMKKTLRQAARLAIRDGSRLAITGFAANSPRGDGFEKRIAERRALNVANFLRNAGFENWIFYHGLNSRQGSEFPGQPRRVEIRLLK